MKEPRSNSLQQEKMVFEAQNLVSELRKEMQVKHDMLLDKLEGISEEITRLKIDKNRADSQTKLEKNRNDSIESIEDTKHGFIKRHNQSDLIRLLTKKNQKLTALVKFQEDKIKTMMVQNQAHSMNKRSRSTDTMKSNQRSRKPNGSEFVQPSNIHFYPELLSPEETKSAFIVLIKKLSKSEGFLQQILKDQSVKRILFKNSLKL